MYNKERNAQSNCDLWRIVNCQHCVIEMLWSFSIAMYLIFNYVTTIHINYVYWFLLKHNVIIKEAFMIKHRFSNVKYRNKIYENKDITLSLCGE